MPAPYELRTHQPMQDFEIAGHKRDAAGVTRVRKPLCESLLEVIAHLPFYHHVREQFDGGAPSESRHIRTRLGDAEIIAISANLNVILRRSQRHKAACQEQE